MSLYVKNDVYTINKAETEEKEVTKSQKNHEAERRRKQDEAYAMAFARRLGELYPGCPYDEQMTIAEHACRRYSGRVGRSSGSKAFESRTIELAVRAHIRHAYTHYDELLRQGIDRLEARFLVEDEVKLKIEEWQFSSFF